MSKRKQSKPGTRYAVAVQLSGMDGNAYSILGRVRRALREAGATNDEISEYFNEATSGDYDHLLRVTMNWVEVR